MVRFSRQKIVNSQSLGEKLIEARTEQNIDLEKAAKDLNIAFKYLYALENNKLSDLPGRAYLKNFLEQYCVYLQLNFKDCWKSVPKEEEYISKKYPIIDRKDFFSWPRFIKKAIIILVVVTILFFLAFKIQEIFIAPPLDIVQPNDGLITTEKQVVIIGQSQPEVEIIVNNKNVFVDSQGKFEAVIDLQEGLNLVKITAKKKYSRIRELEIRVLLNENN